MDTKKNPKKKMKIVKKPYVKGSIVDASTVKDALRFFGGTVIMMLAFLLLSSMMIWDNLTLRIITNGVVLVLAWLLFYASGVSKGAVAVNSGEILYQRQQEGKALDNADVRASFHTLKGFVTGIIGDLPCLACAIVLALIAQRQMYSAASLPSWLESYTRRSEIGDALAYYSVSHGMSLESILRVIVRTMIMPLVSIVGTESSANLLTLEHLAPLAVLMPALFYGVGYTQGVNARAQVHSSIAAANKKHRKQEKKKQQQRRVQEPKQLN